MKSIFYRFVAAEVSYFSGKVRPALRIKHVPFIEVLPTGAVMEDVFRRTKLGFLPIVITPEDETWQDSSDILDLLEANFPSPPLFPTSPLQRVVSFLIEVYADEFLLLPAMHYRWSFADSAAKAEGDFAAFTGDPAIARQLAVQLRQSLPNYGISPSSIPAIEAHTRDLLDCLSVHFREQPYIFGGAPSIADCALAGPLYAHLYLDAHPGRLLRETAQPVCHWIERMTHPDPQQYGTWRSNDQLPPTLRPLIELIGKDAVPLLLDSISAIESSADSQGLSPDEPPSRYLGEHETELRGVPIRRLTNTYALWLVQRPLHAYTSLDEGARRYVDQTLAGTGCEALFAYKPRHVLTKRKFQLSFVS